MNKKMAQLGEKSSLTKEDVRKLAKIGISGLFALFISLFTVGLSDSNAVEVKPQSEKDKANPLSERCGLRPEKGPCKAIFDKYYFDAGTNKCQRFNYGGCDGVAPFETQEECDKACIGQISEKPVIRPSTGHKYGGISLEDFNYRK